MQTFRYTHLSAFHAKQMIWLIQQDRFMVVFLSQYIMAFLGFGRTSLLQGSGSKVLLELEIKTVDDETCRKDLGRNFAEGMLCGTG